MTQHPDGQQPSQPEDPTTAPAAPQHGSMPPAPQYGAPPVAPQYGAPPAAPGYPAAPAYGPGGAVSDNPGMGVRLAARVLDGIIVGIPFMIIYFLALAGAMSQVETDPATGEVTGGGGAIGAAVAVVLLLALLTLLYEVVMIALRGATLGKSIMKIKVVREDTGAIPGWGPSIVRWIIPVVGSFLCGVGQLLVYISPFFDSSGRQQGWHDKAAHTLVVRATQA